MIRSVAKLLLVLCAAQIALGQSDPSLSIGSLLPRLFEVKGFLHDLDGGNTLEGTQTVIFSIYKARQGGNPLWSQSIAIVVDDKAHYVAHLGSPNQDGAFLQSLFVDKEARWISVTPSDGVERPRIAIRSVPYAFTAGNADTLGGKGVDDFVSKEELAVLLGLNTETVLASGSPQSQPQNSFVPALKAELFDKMTESPFARLRIANRFEVEQIFRQGLILPASTIDTGQKNLFDSAPLDIQSAIVPSGTATYLNQTFRLVAQPDTSSPAPGAKLSLLFGSNATPAPTGLSFNSNGTINFAPDQLLPTQAVMNAISAGQNTATASTSASQPAVVNTNSYNWSQTFSSNGIKAGSDVVTMNPCPRGVNGNDQWHYLYVSKTGTPEVVLITGGTCQSGQSSGTLSFTAQYDHPAGYVISSATDGVQEAIIAAALPSTGGQLSRSVMIDPGNHLFRARLSIRASGLTINNSGSTITCVMQDTCIMLGDPSNSNLFRHIVIMGLKLLAGVPGGTWTALEDNANGSTVANLMPVNPSISGASFGSLIQIDNDQAAQVTGLDTNLGAWSRCDVTFCSTAIVGPGQQNSGVIWVENSDLALNCAANGIDNQDGNTLHVSNTVIEAYPQFGIRSRSSYSTVPNVHLDNVYQEIGNCTNPRGTGMAGLIVEGGYAQVSASSPAGQFPVFSQSGSTAYNYFIVVHSSTMGVSPAYLAGFAYTNGSGSIPVVWNQVGNSGIVTYDVLRTIGANAPPPVGTGAFAVATNVPASTCVTKLCTFVDDASSPPLTYSVSPGPGYWPALTMWPGNVILTTASDYVNNGGGTPTLLFSDYLPSTGNGIISGSGNYAPSVFAQVCGPTGLASYVWTQCAAGDAGPNNQAAQTGTLMQMSGGGLKGRLIFEEAGVPLVVYPTHVITLEDSNPQRTIADPNNRPSWDTNDTYIGYDGGNGGTQLSFGAPMSISHYIGNVGDNVNWGERLTKYEKTFQVPVVANNNMTITGNLVVDGSCLGGGCGPFSPMGTQVKSTFTGSNGALDSNWMVTAGEWSVQNNMATFNDTTGNGAMAAYVGKSFDPDQYATAKVIFGPGGTTGAGVGVRMSASDQTGYVCLATPTLTLLLKYASGARMGLEAPLGPGFSSGDFLTIEVAGNTVSCLENGAPIPGQTAVDPSPIVSGYPGLFGEYGYKSFLSNFSAGNFAYQSGAPLSVESLRILPVQFARLASCGTGTEGQMRPVTDSPINTWGAAVTVGNGPYHVSLYCDGTSWTVSAK